MNSRENRAAIARSWYATWHDQLGPAHLWPDDLRRIIYRTSHLNNKDVHTVTCFLLGNGIAPNLIDSFIQFRYSPDAKRTADYRNTIQKYRAGTLKMTYWDVYLQRSESM
jgi:hypothetical protein